MNNTTGIRTCHCRQIGSILPKTLIVEALDAYVLLTGKQPYIPKLPFRDSGIWFHGMGSVLAIITTGNLTHDRRLANVKHRVLLFVMVKIDAQGRAF